jgi:predicted transcriptional regulator
MDHEALNLSRRKQIFTHIDSYPGTYLREMEKALSLSIGDLQYHLQQLEKAELISALGDGRRKRYFTKEVCIPDREVLSVIQLRTPRHIVLFLLDHPDARFQEILAEFKFSKGTLSFHMKKLTKADIVLNARRENEVCYRIKDELRMRQVLMTYHAGFLDEAVNGFVDLWTKI